MYVCIVNKTNDKMNYDTHAHSYKSTYSKTEHTVLLCTVIKQPGFLSACINELTIIIKYHITI